jgi:hypothetical protein
MSYAVIVHPQSHADYGAHLGDLLAGTVGPGARLSAALAERAIPLKSAEDLLDALVSTKVPRIFAEAEVRGDGSDWTPAELSLLGDVGVATEVQIFDDGRHERPSVHREPLQGWLLFTAGTLLRNDRGGVPADADAVLQNGKVDPERYDALVERRLLPLLHFADERASERGRRALVTVPGIGCGQFAGRFRGTMGAHLERALRRLLERHGTTLPHVRAVYFDPFAECANRRYEVGGVSLLVRPLQRGNEARPQLCPPAAYAEPGDDFGDCVLCSVVAWDHVSWPGNDFWAGARTTDDGVKAAATDAMRVLTGVDGAYDATRNEYLPPAPYATWEALVRHHRLRMSARGRLRVLPHLAVTAPRC